jgi:hypothetical protein
MHADGVPRNFCASTAGSTCRRGHRLPVRTLCLGTPGHFPARAAALGLDPRMEMIDAMPAGDIVDAIVDSFMTVFIAAVKLCNLGAVHY